MKQAEKISGLAFSESQRKNILDWLNGCRKVCKDLRYLEIKNETPYSLYFNPVPSGTSPPERLGKEQSNTFDAMVTCYSLVMIRYLLLIYILSKRRLVGPLGSLFREVSENKTVMMLAETVWAYLKELIIRSSDVLCYRIEPDVLFHFFDIIEDSIIRQTRFVSAKL